MSREIIGYRTDPAFRHFLHQHLRRRAFLAAGEAMAYDHYFVFISDTAETYGMSYPLLLLMYSVFITDLPDFPALAFLIEIHDF